MRGKGFRLVASLRARSSSAPIISTHHPRGPKFVLGTPLGLVAYGVWGPVIQSPARRRLTMGQISPSPRGQNSRPYLPMIPISPLLCARPRGDGVGASRPLPRPLSPPELSIQFVEILSFLSSSLLASSCSKYQRFVPRTTNCPPQSKNWLCQFLYMPHLNKLAKPIFHDMHPGVRTEVQKGVFLHRFLTTTSFHRAQNSGPGSKLQFKKSTSVIRMYVFNVYFKSFKNIILNIGLEPLPTWYPS